MRIAYLINQYPKVSHTFIRREILELENQGVEVSRYALRGWDADVSDPEDQEEKSKTRYTLSEGIMPLLFSLVNCAISFPKHFWSAFCAAIAMSRKSIRPWPYHLVYLAHACRIRLWLEDKPASHLHAHFGTNSAEIAMLIRLLGGPDYSFTVHGMDEADNAQLLGFEKKVSRAKFVVAISNYTRSQLMRHVGSSLWSKIKVIHCGLPSEAFTQIAPAEPENSPQFLCIGRLSPEKGHMILLEAFALLHRNYPEAQLVLAGDGELRAEIEAQARILGIDTCVRITGWISSKDVRAELSKCHALVLPSLIEGLPVVIMEAMAQSRPVVSTYIAGIPELVLPDKTGWLVPAGDVGSLVIALTEAFEIPAKARLAMGEEARKRVFERHNIKTEVAKLCELFANLD